MSLLPVRLEDLVHARTVESVRIDFKKTWDPMIRTKVVQTVAAFANDFQGLNGGYLVLGIIDDGGKPVLPPFGLDDLDLERVQKEIRGACERIVPPYQPIIVPDTLDGRAVIVIWAPMGDARPYQAPSDVAKGAPLQYYVRIGPETHETKPAVLTQLHQLAARVPFDERRRTDVALGVIAPRLLARYLRDVGSDLAADADTIDVRDVLRRLRLTGGVNGTEGPRNAALLFFTEEPEDYFPRARIELAQFRDDAGGDVIETRSFHGPLSLQIAQVLDYLAALFGDIVRKTEDDPQVERVVAYPTRALREAIVNAIYHRSYDAGGLPTRVALYPDRVEVTSYPGPVPGIELSHFDVGARPAAVPPRNPRIGEMLRALRLAETWQTGIPKIHRAMHDNGSGAPRFEFDTDRTYFRIVLPAHPGYVVLHATREAAALWHQGMEVDAINHLTQALHRVPTSGALVAQQIEYLARTGNLDVAREVFVAFEQQAGGRDRHLAYMALGRAYLDAELTEEAAETFQAAPRPPDLRQQIDLAVLHKRSRNLKEASRQFAEIAPQIQSDARALHEFAQTKLELARRIRGDDGARRVLLHEVLDMLGRVTELAHDQRVRASHAWFDIARARSELGDAESAIEDARRRALALNPSEPRFNEALPRRG